MQPMNKQNFHGSVAKAVLAATGQRPRLGLYDGSGWRVFQIW